MDEETFLGIPRTLGEKKTANRSKDPASLIVLWNTGRGGVLEGTPKGTSCVTAHVLSTHEVLASFSSIQNQNKMNLNINRLNSQGRCL